jgi:hypothetical protein
MESFCKPFFVKIKLVPIKALELNAKIRPIKNSVLDDASGGSLSDETFELATSIAAAYCSTSLC